MVNPMALRSVDPERGEVILHKRTGEPLAELRFNDRGFVVLAGADLREAALSGTDLGGAILSRAQLSKAALRGAGLRQTHLVEAALDSADLAEADLSQADLRWANLQGANLRGATLTGALLAGADLRGADLTDAVVEDSGLLEIEWDETTIWPHGKADPDWQRRLLENRPQSPEAPGQGGSHARLDDTIEQDGGESNDGEAAFEGPVEIQVLDEFDEGLDVLSLESDSIINQESLLDRFSDVVMGEPLSEIASRPIIPDPPNSQPSAAEPRRSTSDEPHRNQELARDQDLGRNQDLGQDEDSSRSDVWGDMPDALASSIVEATPPLKPLDPATQLLELMALAGLEQGAYNDDEMVSPARTNTLIATAVATDWQSLTEQHERAEAIAALAGASEDEARKRVEAAVGSFERAVGIKTRQRAIAYLSQVPGLIRHSLQRPADPQGLSVPTWFDVQRPVDVLPFLPGGRPMFKRGDRPLPTVDLELKELLGAGGFGEVWRAENPYLPGMGSVALKFFRATGQQAREQLLHEARVVDRVVQANPDHPGLVRLQNTYLSAERPCLQFEYVSGCNLSGLIRHQWQDYRNKAYEIIACIASIVGLGHRLNPPLVHRDLKPSNILIAKTNTGYQFKVADFGIGAWITEQTLEQRRAAVSGSLTGSRSGTRGVHTPGYASPQQIEGADPDPRDDVYALGIIWYQLLTGETSGNAPTGWHWMRDLKRLGHTDRQIMLIASCLEHEPNHRARDAGSLARLIMQEFDPRAARRMATATGQATPAVAPQARATPPKAHAPAPTGGPASVAHRPRVSHGSSLTSAPQVLMLENSIGLRLAFLPAGNFLMGSPASEKGHHADEGPQHEVRLSRTFGIGVLPVSWGQFRAVMNAGVRVLNHFERFDDLPAEGVSWEDAVEFCRRLSKLDDERASARRYRLPTEAEWEYACRGGTTSPFWCGNALGGDQANFLANQPYGQATPREPAGMTLPLQPSDRPNPFGLYQMHGNVWEWVLDEFVPYPADPQIDPVATAENRDTLERVARGGDAFSPGHRCRSAARLRIPVKRGNDGRALTLPGRAEKIILGFRVACEIDG